MFTFNRHVLAIDEGSFDARPFDNTQCHRVPLVAVMMECPHIVESVATGALEVDAKDVAHCLTSRITELRSYPSGHVIMLGSIPMVGLGIPPRLASATDSISRGQG